MLTVTYRKATLSDAIACVKILLDWIEETPWMPAPEQDRQYLEEDWTAAFSDPESWKTWFAENSTQIVGFCIRQVRDDNNIAGLYVVPEARSVGVGRDLLELAKENCSHITVWAFEANDKARKFYHREGLVEVSREIDDVTKLVDIEHRWKKH